MTNSLTVIYIDINIQVEDVYGFMVGLAHCSTLDILAEEKCLHRIKVRLVSLTNSLIFRFFCF